MLKKFGKPGSLTKDCSDPTGKVKKLMKSDINVGPFEVTGLGYAVDSLEQVFVGVLAQLPEVFAEVKSAGMICVRHRRNNPSRFSNHSWGCAIDLYFGKNVVPQGTHLTHRGVLLLVPYFNNHGWYWGGEFSGDSVDSMHFELAEETILKMPT